MSSFVDNAKERLEAVGDKVADKMDEVRADAKVKGKEAELKEAEAERDDTQAKNDFKGDLRD